MATISAVVIPQNKKKDGTWNVNIRIWHNGKAAYIDTVHFVSLPQLKKDGKGFRIKDHYILDRVAPVLKKYRDWISDHAHLVEQLSAQDLKGHLKRIGQSDSSTIDFLEFSKSFIEEKKRIGKESASRTLQTVYNSLLQYNGPYLAITEINYNFLVKYEKYLRSPRTLMVAKNGGGTMPKQVQGLSDSGLHNHMRDLRLLFNEARNKYNDEDQGIIMIAHYPFKKYKLGPLPVTPHRDRPLEEIKHIRDADLPENSRAEMARDLAMLSLYMCGMNAADLYELPIYKGAERIGYNRAKTRGKRRDKAFISVKVIDEAKPLLKKYAGRLQQKYSSTNGLNKAIDIGMGKVSEVTGIPDIDFYDFRHCVGTWARNLCGFSKDDVAAALNQNERTVTDIYIAPDFSVVDRVQEAIVSLLAD